MSRRNEDDDAETLVTIAKQAQRSASALEELLAIARRDGRDPALVHPACDCGVTRTDDGIRPTHSPWCASIASYGEHVHRSAFEWRRAGRLSAALQVLRDAVASEVSFRPDVERHAILHRAYELAVRSLTSDGASMYPGDDGLPSEASAPADQGEVLAPVIGRWVVGRWVGVDDQRRDR